MTKGEGVKFFENLMTSFMDGLKDEWGFVYPQSDGTFRGTGVVGDVFSGKTPLAVTAVDIIIERDHPHITSSL